MKKLLFSFVLLVGVFVSSLFANSYKNLGFNIYVNNLSANTKSKTKSRMREIVSVCIDECYGALNGTDSGYWNFQRCLAKCKGF